MTMFHCIITQTNVTLDNVPKWVKTLRTRCFMTSSNDKSLATAYKNILIRYGVTNIEEYIQLVTKSLESDNIQEINKMYEQKKTMDIAENLTKEEHNLQNKVKESISKISIPNLHNSSENGIIRMLTTDDEDDATELYVVLKQFLKENIENAREYVQDFILKNVIYGIFINDNTLAGFVIVRPSKYFNIDVCQEKVPTFYLQELIIHPKYRGNKFSKYLLEYCIIRCPQDKMYMSLMTTPENYALQFIAESVGFVKQQLSSGDSNNPILMIKKIE